MLRADGVCDGTREGLHNVSVALVRYDAACQALAEAKAVDEVKHIRDVSIAMRAYARQAKNKDLEADAWEIRIRAERRVGELIAAQRETEGLNVGSRLAGPSRTRQDERPTLADAGIDKHLADRARKLTKTDHVEFEQRLAEGRARIMDVSERVRVDLIASTAHVGQNSGENEWYTPEPYIKAARQVLGGIELDPASSKEANAVVKAKAFYSIDDDGLMREWKGTVWMNPPYAQPLIAQFCNKLTDSVTGKTVTAAVVLVNNATETGWFREVAEMATAVCFPTGRVRFWSPGKESAAPLQGQAVLYIGPKTATFVATFSHLGIVWVKP